MMKEKINVAEILKDCPTGMELDCVMFENVTFSHISESSSFPIQIETPIGQISLSKYGGYVTNELSKCVIFPKGKTTWEGFQRPFKDGDVVVSSLGNIHILKNRNTSYIFVDFEHDSKGCLSKSLTTCVSPIRLATEEEKQRLFQVIEDNGYRWNEETKTLEELVEPKFKVGDKVVKKDDPTECWYVKGIATYNNSYHHYDIVTKSKYSNLHFEDQDNWELVPNHKFKVGDVIKAENPFYDYKIIKITDTHYTLETIPNAIIHNVEICEDKNWKLIPNKFDISTLKPFESKVLVRDVNHHEWEGAIFGRYDGKKFFTIGGFDWGCCIPYEGNEHLHGTTNDCDEFYKNW